MDLVALLRTGSQALGQVLTEAQLTLLARYAELTLKWNRIVNLTAAPSTTAFVTDHIIDCLAASPHMRGPHIADIGSGAGLPGIVLAIARSADQLYLIEPRAKRARFLTQLAIELELANVMVVGERVQDWVPRDALTTITCRAYGSLQQFAADTLGLQHAGGVLVALKGAVAESELAALGERRAQCRLQLLQVPGLTQRQLVIIPAAVGTGRTPRVLI